MQLLLMLALLPVVVLCYFIYKRDYHKEPKELLQKLFIFGCLTVIPILFFELFLDQFFSTDNVYDFLTLFINIFVSIGLVEEGFKWIVVKKVGYDNQEFDEIYDIIVYSVFVSLGFACVENVLYVFRSGFLTALVRAITAVPGHTCFAVFMGYYFSKAKVNEINQNHNLSLKNLLCSLFVPVIVHTMYDAIVMFAEAHSYDYLGVVFDSLFYLFIIIMFCIGFVIVDKISKIQSNVTNNIENGNISYQQGSVSMNTMQINQAAIQQAAVNQTASVPTSNTSLQSIPVPNYCPICGKPAHGANYCGFCGYQLKQ